MPAIHVLVRRFFHDVDARDKCMQDGESLFDAAVFDAVVNDLSAGARTHLWTPRQMQAVFEEDWRVVGCCHLSGL